MTESSHLGLRTLLENIDTIKNHRTDVDPATGESLTRQVRQNPGEIAVDHTAKIIPFPTAEQR